MNFVYCSDLKNHQVIGTFLETLYYLQLNNKNPVPLVIVGSRDAHKLPALKEFLFESLNIREGIYKVNSEHNLVEDEKIATSISTEEELKNVTYSGINIGIGILSSIISKHRCTCLCLEKWQDEISTYIHHAKLFLESFKRTINQHVDREDTIYIYNGRHYNTYPQTLFCEQHGYNITYYERMNSWKNLRFQKARIHDFNATSDIVKLFWETSKDPLKVQIAEHFYEENIRNKFSKDFSSSKELFDSMGSDREIVSYFASSEDEYAALDPRISLSDIFDSQRDAINYLINWAASQDKYLLVIRLHPNQKNICEKDYKFWHSISGKNVTLVPSHSSLSSYELAKKSSIVLSYLSTIGIEATRMCIPSITLGNPMYKGLNAVFEPNSKEQLLQLLQTKLLPKAAANALPYGYYNLCYGPSLKLMEVLGLNEFSEYSKILN